MLKYFIREKIQQEHFLISKQVLLGDILETETAIFKEIQSLHFWGVSFCCLTSVNRQEKTYGS